MLFKNGLLSRAAATLKCTPLAPFSPGVHAALKALHPHSAWRLPEAEFTQSFEIPTAHSITKALKSFPRGAAAGPYGLRPDHLKAHVNHPGASMMPVLFGIVGSITGGRVPIKMRPRAPHRPRQTRCSWCRPSYRLRRRFSKACGKGCSRRSSSPARATIPSSWPSRLRSERGSGGCCDSCASRCPNADERRFTAPPRVTRQDRSTQRVQCV